MNINYTGIVQESLHSVVRSILTSISKNGLNSSNYFYISFLTNHEGVISSNSLKKKYPYDMTIVIQHQFWDLKVFDDYFCISLSFGNISENLRIPFASLISFMDPSVMFGMQFTPLDRITKEAFSLDSKSSVDFSDKVDFIKSNFNLLK